METAIRPGNLLNTAGFADIQNTQKQILDETRKTADNPNAQQRQQTAQALNQREQALRETLEYGAARSSGPVQKNSESEAANAARAAANSLQTNRVADE